MSLLFAERALRNSPNWICYSCNELLIARNFLPQGIGTRKKMAFEIRQFVETNVFFYRERKKHASMCIISIVYYMSIIYCFVNKITILA